jgi:photosystem II stability/assembly factor-like uncharacterized protein
MKFIRIVIVLICCLNAYAQYTWRNPNPSPHKLYGIHFCDSLTGWTVGELSTVLKTTDGGESWFLQSVPLKSTLRRVEFVNKNTGWIIGGEEYSPDLGSVLCTTDGGKNWTDHNPIDNYSNGWNDISVLSKDLIYIGGFNGVYKSTDGGYNWVKKGGSNWTTTVFFLDSLIGWYGNTVGGLFKTIDGGETWSQVADMRYTFQKKIKFVDKKIGYLISEGLYSSDGFVYKSIDGGVSWQLKDSIAGFQLKSLDIIDSSNVIIAGAKGILMNTTNGGDNWNYQYLPEQDDCYEVKKQNSKIWIVGGGYMYGRIYLKEERYIVEKSIVFTKDYLNGVDFYNEQNGIAAGQGGSIIVTKDSGLTWENLDIFSIDFTSVCFLNANFISLAGRNGEFVKSSDGGKSWSVSTPFPGYSSNKIKFFSENVGYSLSQYDALQKTSDGGNSWSEISEYGVYDFFFTDSTNGWFLTNPLETDYSVIFSTKDGGQSWTSLQFQDYVNNIFFLDKNTGWLSSENRLYKSIDGGTTWNLANDNLDFYINQIIFTSENRGYFLTKDFFNGSLTSVKYTVNGGESFSSIIDYTLLNYMTIVNNKLWCSGESGHILEVNLDLLTSIADKSESVITNYNLSQNYPNPFNPTTTINYAVPKACIVSIKIYDVLGREIETLVNDEKPKGNFKIDFYGGKFSSGIYFYRMQAGDFVETKKFILLK